MVELQSCAPVVNVYALGAIEEEMRGDSVNVISEISAELERERQKNAELKRRIRILEAEIKEREEEFPRIDGKGCCSNAMERRFKTFKRQKIEPTSNRTEDRNIIPSEMASQEKHHKQSLGLVESIPEGRAVNWMSMEETQFLHLEKVKDGDSGECDETDDSDDEDNDYREEEGVNDSRIVGELKCEVVDKGSDVQCAKVYSDARELVIPNVSQQNELSDVVPVCNEIECRQQNKKEPNDLGSYKVPPNTLTLEKEFLCTGSGSVSQQKKSSKVAFCPKEVNRIIDSEALMQKNAHSHTIRKIIIFASLGIRHGCEDIYELNFNHFTILRKGEPYMSSKDPGEHVLYENPGVRRKVFYPNQQNPTLCPVQVLEEEKAMRPSDPSCPSWLFLCIKYGGRTRNLPQNEYVRQRMGRNKLKSFGPLMCQMAMLIHIRSGSFFFKALGNTLLFMAGFPDDLVQRETKYRNLDLIQKYYRTDEDAKEEELFLPHQMPCETASPGSQQLCGEICSTKTKGKKKRTQPNSKHQSMQRSAFPQISSSALSTQWQAHATATFQSMPSPYHTPLDTPAISNTTMIGNAGTNSITFPSQTPYHIFPPQPAVNTFVPVVFWPPPNAFTPGPYQSSFGYQSFPSGNYLAHPQPYYNHPSCSRLIPKMGEAVVKNGTASEGADSDYDCSSSSIETKKKN